MEYNILTTLWGSYSKYLIVTYHSLIKSNPDKLFHFYIVSNSNPNYPFKLDEKERKIIENYVKTHSCKIDFIDIDCSLFDSFRKDSREKGYAQLVYAKLVPHIFLPNNLTRILYVESDQVINGDISKLYNEDFSGNLFLSCRVHYSLIKYKKSNGNDLPNNRYVNTGVIVYNLTLLREENIGIEYYYKCHLNNPNYFYDEGLFNLAMSKRIKLVPSIYNYEANNYEYCKFECEQMRVFFSPVIHHYCGSWSKGKPWEQLDIYYWGINRERLSDNEYHHYKIWWEYAKETPFFEEIITAQIPKVIKDTIIYWSTTGTPEDLNRSIDFLSMIEKTDELSITYSDLLLKRKRSSDISKSIEILSYLSTKNNVDALGRLARCNRNGTGIKQDINKAIQYYSKALKINQESEWIKSEYVECLLKRNTNEDFDLAMSLIDCGIKQKMGWAYGRRAEIFRDGIRSPIDLDKAIEYYLLSINFNNRWAKRELILLLKNRCNPEDIKLLEKINTK